MTIIYGLTDSDGVIRYVGKTRVAPKTRLRQHQRTRAWAIGIIELERVPEGEAWQAYERKHIALQRERVGALLENKTRGGESWPSECSPETRAKMSETRKGRRLSDAHRAATSAGRMGIKFSDQTRAKMSAARTGIERSSETRAKIADFQRGRTRSPETRARMSAAKMGHTVTPETRAKISASNRAYALKSH